MVLGSYIQVNSKSKVSTPLAPDLSNSLNEFECVSLIVLSERNFRC